MWNIPVQVIKNIKQILNIKGLLKILPLQYNTWLDALKNIHIEEHDQEVIQLIHDTFSLLQETKVDYHIMNLEGLLTVNDEHEEDAPFLTLQDRMEKVYSTTDFSSYQSMYATNINKKKNLLIECIKYVSSMQDGDYLLLKYRPEVTFYDLWNEFYMETRGIVIDIQDMKLVSCPYRKFFNLNEKPLTNLQAIQELIKKAYSVTIKNKEDGSMISCSKYKDQLVVATPGSLNSDQAKWAKSFIQEHYPTLKESLPDHLTFIFEAIYPDNRIVVDYGKTENLILTNIRNKETGRLLEENEVEYYASLFHLPTPQKETKGLLELIETAKDRELYPANEKEGWVFVIRTKDEERLFKLKCDDYCEVHRIISYATSPKIVFQKIKSDTWDDFFTKIPDTFKPLTLKIADVVFNYIEKTQQEVQRYLNTIPSELLYTQEEIDNYYSFISILSKEVLPQINPKLSKNAKAEIEQILFKRTFGKEAGADKWIMKEVERLWGLIPDKLKDQKNYKMKSGRLIGYIKKNIPSKYQCMAFNYVEHKPYEVLDIIKYRDIDFSPITKDLSKYEDEN